MVEFMMMWESMAAWFTPIVLFCLTNFIIVTIFIASNKHHDHGESTSLALAPLVRVSSFFDRARSVTLSSYTTTESQHHYPPQSKTANYTSTSRLAQSIYSSSTPPELPGSPSQPASENVFPVQSNSPGQLARAPSFLSRVKSFKISSVLKSEPDPVHNPEHHVNRIKSEKTPEKKSTVEMMKKSRSEVKMAADDDDDVDMRRPATARESRGDLDEEVDVKADDFISRFKQQLKLQRLESLVRYNEMLNRRR